MIDRYRGYQPSRPTSRKSAKRVRKRKPVIWLLLALVIYFGWKISQQEQPKTQKNTVQNVTQVEKPKVFAEAISKDKWNELSKVVNAAIAGQPDYDISVAVIDVSSKTKANFGIQDNFVGASTTKVVSAVAYLHQVESNKRSLTTQIDGKTAKEHLGLMINESNNESWLALNTNLSHDTLENYAHSLGLSSYDATKNVITASDEAVLLQKLYSGQLLNAANTKLLLSLMQDTNNEDMIPRAAPDGSQVYHKYGQLDDRLHDAAIVDYKNSPVVLVIYTKGGPADGSAYGVRAGIVRQLAKQTLDTIYSD